MSRDGKRLAAWAGVAIAAIAAISVYLYVQQAGTQRADAEELMVILEQEAAGADANRPTAGPAGHGPSPQPGGSVAGGPSVEAVRRADPRVIHEVTRIARKPRPEHVEILKVAARNPDPEVREAATFGLGRLGEHSDPRFLMQMLKTETSPAVLIAAATALGNLKCWEAGSLLIDLLEHPDVRVRSRAAAALNKIIGVDMGIRPDGPYRKQRIQRLREWWPDFYARRKERKAVRG